LFLTLVNQTLGAKLAINFWVAAGHTFLKTLQTIGHLILLTRGNPFTVRMVTAIRHNKNVLYHTFRGKNRILFPFSRFSF
jgi:hypothetical protein